MLLKNLYIKADITEELENYILGAFLTYSQKLKFSLSVLAKNCCFFVWMSVVSLFEWKMKQFPLELLWNRQVRDRLRGTM